MITFAQYTIFVDNIIYDINPYKNDIAKVARKNGGYSGNITIPETINYNDKTYRVTTIDSYAFHNCQELTSVSLPNSITTIGYSAFSYCNNLTKITMSTNTTSIGEEAFCGCSKLSEISIPNSVATIGHSAFERCRSLTTITIPTSMTSISYRTFYKCSNLTSVTIPKNIKSVGDEAFYGCSNLNYVFIYKLYDLGMDVFSGCINLSKVVCLTKVPLHTHDGVFSPSKDAILYVPEEAIDEYKKTYPWNVFKTIKAIDKYTTTQISATSAKSYDIKAYGNTITIYNDVEGQKVSVFTIDGRKIGTSAINNGSATIITNLQHGSIAIVKIGQTNEKVFIK